MSIFLIYMQTSIFNLANHFTKWKNLIWHKSNIHKRNHLWKVCIMAEVWSSNLLWSDVICKCIWQTRVMFHCIAFPNHNLNYRVSLCTELCAHFQRFSGVAISPPFDFYFHVSQTSICSWVQWMFPLRFSYQKHLLIHSSPYAKRHILGTPIHRRLSMTWKLIWLLFCWKRKWKSLLTALLHHY